MNNNKVLETTKQAYAEILEVVKKHKDVCKVSVERIQDMAQLHLFGLELSEVYGLNIEARAVLSMDWQKFGEYRTIGRWGEKHGRTISWSVDGRQPQDEMLLQIAFPTGPYIFGDDYPTALFQRFWLELKTFNANYADEANKCLYWTLPNAKEAFNAFDDLLEKYHEINRAEAKQRQIAKLKDQLNQLEGSEPQ